MLLGRVLVAMNDDDESVLIQLEKLHSRGEITDEQFETLVSEHYAAKEAAQAEASAAPEKTQEPEPPDRPVGPAIIIGASGAAMILGSFMPWATVGFISVSGIDGDGVFTAFFGIGIIAAAIGWGLTVRKSAPLTSLVLSVLGIWVAANVFNNLDTDTIGTGLLMVLAAGLVGAVMSIGALLRPKPKDVTWGASRARDS